MLKREEIAKISSFSVDNKEMLYLVREYLVHSGYQDTFEALEASNAQTANEDYSEERMQSIFRKDSEFMEEYKMLRTGSNLEEEPEHRRSLRKRSASMMMERAEDDKIDVFGLMNFIDERKAIQDLLVSGRFDEAKEYYDTRLDKGEPFKTKVSLCFCLLKFLRLLRNAQFDLAYEEISKLEETFWEAQLTVFLTVGGDIRQFGLREITTCLFYSDISTSDMKFLLDPLQERLLITQINNTILESNNLNSESVLESVIKQTKLCETTYKLKTNSVGETLKLNVNF